MEAAASDEMKIGVLIYNRQTPVDAALKAAVDDLRARGFRVGGLLQRSGDTRPSGICTMWLDDIASGHAIRLDQQRGPGAMACLLDPDALARGAVLLRQAIEAGMDVVVVNRFGGAEADGGGLRQEIAEAVFSGAAVLIAVRDSLLPDLQGFLGIPVVLLPPSAPLIADWAAAAAPARDGNATREQSGAGSW